MKQSLKFFVNLYQFVSICEVCFHFSCPISNLEPGRPRPRISLGFFGFGLALQPQFLGGETQQEFGLPTSLLDFSQPQKTGCRNALKLFSKALKCLLNIPVMGQLPDLWHFDPGSDTELSAKIAASLLQLYLWP